MLGISLPELLVIGACILLVIPAKDLPRVLRYGARLYKKACDLYTQLLREINLLN